MSSADALSQGTPPPEAEKPPREMVQSWPSNKSIGTSWHPENQNQGATTATWCLVFAPPLITVGPGVALVHRVASGCNQTVLDSKRLGSTPSVRVAPAWSRSGWSEQANSDSVELAARAACIPAASWAWKGGK